MGGKTSAQHFSWVLDSILRDIKSGQQNPLWSKTGAAETTETSGVCNYMDDILIYSESKAEHLRLLDLVMKRLIRFGLRAKLSKTYIGYRKLKFLGRIVSREGVEADPEKVAPILALVKPEGPQAKTQLRAICGGVNYYKAYIKDYAGLMEPLNELLKKGVNVVDNWTDIHDDALQNVKDALSSAPVLAYPDPNKKFIVKTDASKGFAAAVCSQEGPQGEQVIEYVSTGFRGPQRNYPMHEKELYALVFAFHKFKTYIDSRADTDVHTDSMALLFLRANKYEDHTGRIIRWFSFLDRFSFNLFHKPGCENTDSDFLTRAQEANPSPSEDPDASWIYQPLLKSVSDIDRIAELTFDGPRLWRDADRPQLTEADVLPVEGNNAADSLDEWKDRLVVAVPPMKRARMCQLMRLLEGVERWALWCPLGVLQETYFNETDIQIVLVQGGRSYLGTKGARYRGAWVTHGCQLARPVIFERLSMAGGKISTKAMDEAFQEARSKRTKKMRDRIARIASEEKTDGAPPKKAPRDFSNWLKKVEHVVRHADNNQRELRELKRMLDISTTELQKAPASHDICWRRALQEQDPEEHPATHVRTVSKERGRFKVPDPLFREALKSGEKHAKAQGDQLGLPEDTKAQTDQEQLRKANWEVQSSLTADPAPNATFTAKIMRALQLRDPECRAIAARIFKQKNTVKGSNIPGYKKGKLAMFLHEGLLKVSPPQHYASRIHAEHSEDPLDGARVYVPSAIRNHLMTAYHRAPALASATRVKGKCGKS